MYGQLIKQVKWSLPILMCVLSTCITKGVRFCYRYKREAQYYIIISELILSCGYYIYLCEYYIFIRPGGGGGGDRLTLLKSEYKGS